MKRRVDNLAAPADATLEAPANEFGAKQKKSAAPTVSPRTADASAGAPDDASLRSRLPVFSPEFIRGQTGRRPSQDSHQSKTLRWLAWIAVLIGLLSLMLRTWLSPAAWGTYAACLLFWTGAEQDGVAFAAMVHLTGARWGRVFARTAAGTGLLLPLSLLLIIPLSLWGTHGVRPEQTRDLTDHLLLLGRDFGTLLLLSLLDLAFLRRLLREEEPPPSWLAVVVLIAGFPILALLSVDWGLAADPRFHDTVYPMLYIAGSFYAGLCLLALLSPFLRRLPPLGREIVGDEDLRDLGNLLWGFAILLAYLWWCEYLPAWMGNLPPEAAHIAARWRTLPFAIPAYGSLTLSCALPILILFSRALKKKPVVLAAVGLMGLVGVTMERHLDILPSLPHTNSVLAFAISFGVTLGFAGTAALCCLWLAKRYLPFPSHDPLLEENIAVRSVVV